jgi:hypothetical protein
VLAENIPVVPLYFSKLRPVVERSGALIMVDDERLPLMPGEQPTMRRVRFRTLGCYPLTGAIESNATSLDDIIAEMRKSTTSERQGRLIDTDEAGSMEKKKREGYFLMNAPAKGRHLLPSPSGRRWREAPNEGLRRLAEIMGPYPRLSRLATHPHPAALRASTFSPREKGAHAAAQRKRA